MMFWHLLIGFVFLSQCDPAHVKTFRKCSIHDNDCFKNMLQYILKYISKIGVPELNIPPVDPVELNNVTVSILGLINITLVDGTAKGIKDCIVDSFDAEIEKGHTKVEYTCDIIIEGKFKVNGKSPLFNNLFGTDSIHGYGNAKIQLDKIHMGLDFIYHFIKKEDGNIYSQCHRDGYRYEYSIQDMKFTADNIFSGDKDSTALLVGVLNQNWSYLMQTYGKSFFDVAMDLLYDFLHRSYDTTPTDNYIIEDLTYLVKNDVPTYN